MTNPNRSRSGFGVMHWAVAGCLLVVVAVVGVWLLVPRRVKLSAHGYDVTIALYRACNQKSLAGLDQVQAMIADESKADAGEADESDRNGADSIREIIAVAKSGQWQQASEACRKLMEDQVER